MPDAAHSLAWDDFRLVNAVAAERSLPAAAARLGIDHSTVFRRLRQIEAAFGKPLFERHRSGYVPTQAGEEVVALAARVDEDITTVTRRLAGQVPEAAGEVRLATSDALLCDLLLPSLARFRRLHPRVHLDVVVSNLPLNLSRRDADVAVRATEAPPETLVGRRVASIAWAPYVLHVAGADADGPAEFAWLGLGDPLSRLKASRHLRDSVGPERIVAHFDTVAALAAAVEAGMGVGYLPCFVGDARPALARLTPPMPELGSELWLLTHADLRHTPRVRVLLDFLAAGIAPLRPLIEGARPIGAPDREPATPALVTPDSIIASPPAPPSHAGAPPSGEA